MSRRCGKGFWLNESGATAALYALALPALVAVAGIGFDYAHVAAMDTELQNAADQAALAGATQLDKTVGSIDRATSAAEGGLVSNETLFANDGQGRAVDDLEVRFYSDESDAEACNGDFLDPDDVDSDAAAAFICVMVEERRANYALTPIVGAMGGNLTAQAAAGVGAALCRTPPLMICNPAEPEGNTNTELDFNPDDYEGLGLLAKGGGGSAWAPGNFGYLDTIPGSGGGTPDLRKALGWDAPIGECISQSANDAVDTDTGNKTDIADSLNTRFDIYNGNTACPTGGNCSASVNSTKDFVHPGSLTDAQACKVGSSGWQEATGTLYLPDSHAALDASTTPVSMGHPRDVCHAMSSDGECDDGPFGDGFWDRDAYFRSHYRRTDGTYWTGADWQDNTGLTIAGGSFPRYPTRYRIYMWEIEHRGELIDGVQILGGPNTNYAYGSPVCSAGAGYGTGTVPSEFTADRRRLSVAVINCVAHGVRGNSTEVPVRRFMDVFLVQPSLARTRTAKDEIYVEVIGETARGSAGETAGTVIRRDVPYLLR